LATGAYVPLARIELATHGLEVHCSIH